MKKKKDENSDDTVFYMPGMNLRTLSSLYGATFLVPKIAAIILPLFPGYIVHLIFIFLFD